MMSYVVPLLRAALGVLFAGVLLGQLLMPVIARDVGGGFEETSHLVGPYAVAGVLSLGCVQLAIVAVWRLLAMVVAGQIFTLGALRWVGAMTAAVGIGALLPTLTLGHLLLVAGVGGPGVLLAWAAFAAGGCAIVLLLMVMRHLLATAIAEHRELSEVI